MAGHRKTMIKCVELVLAMAGLITGLVAALKWREASTVKGDLGYLLPDPQAGRTYVRGGVRLARHPESGDPEVQRMNEMDDLVAQLQDAAYLNKAAAIWTAWSVTLNAAATLAPFLAQMSG